MPRGGREGSRRTVELGPAGTSTSADPEPPIKPSKAVLTYGEPPHGEPPIVPSKAHLTTGKAVIPETGARDKVKKQSVNVEPTLRPGARDKVKKQSVNVEPTLRPEPDSRDYQRHLSSQSDLVASSNPLMVHSISGRPVDQEFEKKLYKENKITLFVCFATCCLGNPVIGCLALLLLLLSYNYLKKGRFLTAMGFNHGALALAVLGIVFAIGMWVCFGMWLVPWRFPWNV